MCGTEAVCDGWDRGHGGQRTGFGRSGSYECTADVHRSGCTGQCIQPSGLSETGDGSDELSWRENGTWYMERRGDYPSDTRRGDFHGRGSEKIRKSGF